MEASKPTLATILTKHWEDFANKNRHMLSSAHYRAVRSVLWCRTPRLGGRLYGCPSCHRKHFAYHSCNHRSCPQCGALEQQLWSRKQEDRLLPADYFMVTFTIPTELRSLCRKHPKELYDLMLKQSSAALKDIVASKLKGALTGCTSVLHTWGRQLQHHPHVHCIVPAAALSPGGRLTLPPNSDFLIHYKPLAQRFRNLMRSALAKHYPDIANKLAPEQRSSLSRSHTWNVQIQHAGRGKTAVRYLARYAKKSGFTDRRLIGYSADKKHILLRWTNSTTNRPGVLKLSVHEFIRRWLLHVLPKGFARIRHYGLLSSAAKKNRLILRALLGQFGEPEHEPPAPSPHTCPHCKANLEFLRELPRLSLPRGPPQTFTKQT